MYLARTTVKNRTHYYIRGTYRDGDVLKSRDLFDLGNDPARHIIYPGGKGYYFDEKIENALHDLGLNPTQDDLDNIFWEFLDPEIKRVINGFQRLNKKEKSPLNEKTSPAHLFDRRRIHYLRFAQTDQGDIGNMPPTLFKHLGSKSRDEIEQYFLYEENILKPREMKRYVHTIFNLENFLRQSCTQGHYDNLNQEGLDAYFTSAVCELNADTSFWEGMPESPRLQSYLIRYVIMYFDYAFPSAAPSRDYVNDFMNRHRHYAPPRKVRESMEEACRLFDTDWDALKRMDSNAFTRLYRKQAMKHHPDQGGNKKKFIRLTKLYENLMRRKR